MKALETHHLLADLCAAFAVSRSGYPAWKNRPRSARAGTDAELGRQLCQTHAASRQTYGSQYASAAYRARVAQAVLVASMSRAGNCYDNAAMESFWGKLKTELVHRRKFASPAEARTTLFEHLEVFDNRRRLHSALGFMSPVDFENQTN